MSSYLARGSLVTYSDITSDYSKIGNYFGQILIGSWPFGWFTLPNKL